MSVKVGRSAAGILCGALSIPYDLPIGGMCAAKLLYFLEMIYAFAGFELDDERRELRLDGEEVRVQPLVLDLLILLLRNSDRVVPKAELLETLWPDAVVVEGALQRAISIARSVLRKGGADRAIRTYPKHGYRFCEDAFEVASTERQVSPRLSSARQAYEKGDWSAAFDGFCAADEEAALNPDDLERLAQSATYTGSIEESVIPLERAIAACRMGGNLKGAARATIMLAHVQFDRREVAVANGWIKQAERMLEGEDCTEAGLLAWLNARMALMRGDMNEAITKAQIAYELGRRLEDPDLEGLGMQYRGLALQALGEVERGSALQDEAAALVLSGEVTSWAGGMIYCGVIWGCVNRGDWQRASQWTDQFSRWCERTGMSNFPGLCRMHRAEVLTVRGDLGEAEKEIREACETLAKSAPWAEGDAWRVMGEIHLARGELDEAESAFRRAHELGWDPEPGYSLLQVARGRAESAIRGLERALESPLWTNRQKRGLMLAHLVSVATAAGMDEKARKALDELDRKPELSATPAQYAVVQEARAGVECAAGNHEEAVRLLREALRIWVEMGSSLHIAMVRLRLAEILVEVEDVLHAELELSSAENILSGLENKPLRRSCVELRKRLAR